MTPTEALVGLVRVIRAIPGHDESVASLRQLLEAAGFDPLVAPDLCNVLVHTLAAFGVLRVESAAGETDLFIKADTVAGGLFLRSFAEYLVSGNSMLDNWSRARTADPPYDHQSVLVGAQFLYLIERRRLALNADAPAIRRTRVAKILIKARFGRGEARYLVVHDQAARQFQFPGGHRRSTDTDMRDVAIRELEMKLPGFQFDDAFDRLADLGTVEITSVSRTYGAATAYELTLFHLLSSRRKLPVGPSGRWLSETKADKADTLLDGLSVNNVGLPQLLASIPGGLEGLDLSLQPDHPNPVVTLATEKPLEFWALIVGIISLALSVAFFMLT